MSKVTVLVIAVIVFVESLAGCASKQSFSAAGRPGDTVVLNVGWHPDLKRDNLTVSIQPCAGDFVANAPSINTTATCVQTSGLPIVYTAADPALRAVVNMYPDPVSQLVFERETQGTGPVVLGETIELFATNQDKEYLQTTVLIDIPGNMPPDSGIASVSLTDAAGDSLSPLFIEILQGSALLSGAFLNWDDTSITNTQFQRLERTNYKTISFSGASVPYAIQIDMTHTGGTLYVVNPRGDVKNINWSDDGANLRAILTPSWNKNTTPGAGETLGQLKHFKFYVAGDVDTLFIPVDGVQGYDINGNPVAGLVATVQ